MADQLRDLVNYVDFDKQMLYSTRIIQGLFYEGSS